MVQKCSYEKVLEVFLVEPTKIHFIKEISRKIKIAPTSVRNNIKQLLSENLIKKKESSPFNGFIANRDNDQFLWKKRAYNLLSLKELSDDIVFQCHPQLLIVFGSYSLGQDIESSDIDILISTETKKEITVKKFEKKIKRDIHLIIINNLNDIEIKIKNKVLNGIVLYGGFDG